MPRLLHHISVRYLVTVLIFAIFWPQHPRKGAPELPIGELRASQGHE